MDNQRVVLVDGVANDWGARVAAQLVEEPGLHVIGLDAGPPEQQIKGLDFIQADLHNPALVDLIREEKVDTLVHLTFAEHRRPSESDFETNVMGAMKILGACAEAGVRKVVLKSSTMVYGANPTNSLYLREDHPHKANKVYGYLRDLVEIEAFCNGLQRQAGDLIVTTLRFGHIVGPKISTPMTRFLRDDDALVLLGFDPMMQIIHENDVINALIYAVQHDAPGAFNVAAQPAMPLWKLMGLAGKLPLPVLHPLAYMSVSMLGPRNAPIELDYLRYPCVGDLARMEAELGFTPQYSADETLREFASQNRLRQYMPESLTRQQEEQRLRETIERRRRQRERAEAKPARPRKVRQPSASSNGQQVPLEAHAVAADDNGGAHEPM
jgi:UDP-glucose 4-epimerase